MSHTPNALHEEFPELSDKITALKESNAHFAKLAEEYHEVNLMIHRAETGLEPVESMTEETFRKQRLRLKDEIYSMLTSA